MKEETMIQTINRARHEFESAYGLEPDTIILTRIDLDRLEKEGGEIKTEGSSGKIMGLRVVIDLYAKYSIISKTYTKKVET